MPVRAKEQRQLREELPEADVEKGHGAQKAAEHKDDLPPGTLALSREVGYAEGHDGVDRVEDGEPLGDVGDQGEVEYGQEALEPGLRPVFSGQHAGGGQRTQPPSSRRAISASRNHISQQSPFFMPTTSAISLTVFMG